MKILFIIFFIFLFILFFPIPLKFTSYYSSENYYIKFYKFILISKYKSNNPKTLNRLIEYNKKNKSKFHVSKYKKFCSKLFYSKFKPSLKINLSFSYSLNDSYNTALIYGLLCTLFSFLYQLVNIPFNIKKYNLNVDPIFKDEILVKFETSSIIFISFAQIIYISIIFIKTSKEGTP